MKLERYIILYIDVYKMRDGEIMKNKKYKLIDACSEVVDISDMCFDADLILFESAEQESMTLELPDPIDALIEAVEDVSKTPKSKIPDRTTNVLGTTRRVSANAEIRINSALADLIEQKTKTKALPLALRKRLMYQQAVESGH